MSIATPDLTHILPNFGVSIENMSVWFIFVFKFAYLPSDVRRAVCEAGGGKVGSHSGIAVGGTSDPRRGPREHWSRLYGVDPREEAVLWCIKDMWKGPQ